MIESGLVESVLDHAGAMRILVVGDVMLDEQIAGTVDRVSPEAPVPVVRIENRVDSLGGAANVARQLVALGAQVDIVGRIGVDAAGERIVELCERIGMGTALLVRDGEEPTTRKQRVTSGGQQLLRLDVETTEAIGAVHVTGIDAALNNIARPGVVIISDYAKGVVTDEMIAVVSSHVRRWGIPVLVDPKSANLGRYGRPAVIKANRNEFENVIGARLEEPYESLNGRAPGVLARSGAQNLIVTLGGRGMVLVDGEASIHVPADDPGRVHDVSGAGDTVIAMLALGMAAGIPLRDTARLANLAAGLVVRHPGVTVVESRDLRNASIAPSGTSIIDIDDLGKAVNKWRADGRSVVFTNGCFDLIHPGHVHLLRRAAALGDVLVVGVNSDRSTRSLKGRDRPVVGEVPRAAMVAAIAEVDAVVLFDEPDPSRLIEMIVPDVLVKGGDYRPEEIVGRQAVLAAGGRVETVPVLEGWSTTRTVTEIRAHPD